MHINGLCIFYTMIFTDPNNRQKCHLGVEGWKTLSVGHCVSSIQDFLQFPSWLRVQVLLLLLLITAHAPGQHMWPRAQVQQLWVQNSGSQISLFMLRVTVTIRPLWKLQSCSELASHYILYTSDLCTIKQARRLMYQPPPPYKSLKISMIEINTHSWLHVLFKQEISRSNYMP